MTDFLSTLHKSRKASRHFQAQRSICRRRSVSVWSLRVDNSPIEFARILFCLCVAVVWYTNVGAATAMKSDVTASKGDGSAPINEGMGDHKQCND